MSKTRLGIFCVLVLLVMPVAAPAQTVLTVTSSNFGATVGVPFSATLQAYSEYWPLTWNLASYGNALPPGLTLSSTGVLSGTPTTAGTYLFTVQVYNTVVNASKTVSLSIAQIAVTTTSLPNANSGTPYSITLKASPMGSQPYAWTWSPYTPILPPGLTLSSTGVLSGTPTTGGAYQFNVFVRDAHGASNGTTLSLYVGPSLPAITTTSIPNGSFGTPYSATLAVTGGIPSYTWALASGILPAGLALSSNGMLWGTPSGTGNYSFTVRVTCASGSAQKSLALYISPPVLKITTTSLPAGAPGAKYSAALAASGGIAPYTWELASGTLPAGLTLSPNGTLWGTPSVPGDYKVFTVRIYDSVKVSVTKSLALTINK